MEPQDNKLLSLQKAISGHEQAEAGLADVVNCFPADLHATMLARIVENLADLHAEVSRLQVDRAEHPEEDGEGASPAA